VTIILDTVAVIHLAKLTILEKVCDHKKVVIPGLVYKELLEGKNKGHLDVPITIDLIERHKIVVKKVEQTRVRRLAQFNIKGGEAEAIALYVQEKATALITDDDNVRKKSALLGVTVIGTPAYIIFLHKNRIITKEKVVSCIIELKKIGWFSQQVIDHLHQEVGTWQKR
jgi:predicted nucleic acid-binding protein